MPYPEPEAVTPRQVILEAIKAVLSRDSIQGTERPTLDSYRWTGMTPHQDKAERRSLKENPDLAKWFFLNDANYLGDRVVVEFSWLDRTTPELRYWTSMNVHETDPSLSAHIAYAHISSLLMPGWRNTVSKFWLAPYLVLIQKPERFAEVLNRTRAALWEESRDAE